MLMPGRRFSTSTYRYGFNGKENDNDIKGEGNEQDYGMRIYDSRIGKFLSVDPLSREYPWYTPFQFAGNKPIIAVDRDGEEELIRINFYSDDGNLNRALFVPLSTHETEELFTDIWADINGITKDRNYKSGTLDRFTNSNAIMDAKELNDYRDGNLFKNDQKFKAPYTGQLTIDLNKPNSDNKFILSYKRELTKDYLFNQYHSSMIENNFTEAGYVTGTGVSNLGLGFSWLGTIASGTVGPEAGVPLLALGSGLGKIGDGLTITMDYIRRDNAAANQKMLLFGIGLVFDGALGKARQAVPQSEKPKIDVFGTAISTGTAIISNSVSSNSSDSPKPRKSEIISNTINIIKKI